mgnify:FL=1
MTRKKRKCAVCGKDLSRANYSKVVDKESGLLVTVCSGGECWRKMIMKGWAK